MFERVTPEFQLFGNTPGYLNFMGLPQSCFEFTLNQNSRAKEPMNIVGSPLQTAPL